MSQSLPDWVGASSIDELVEGLYPSDANSPGSEDKARKLLRDRAERLLLSYEMIGVWSSLKASFPATNGRENPIFNYFFVAMNAELTVSLTPEPSNSRIQAQHLKIANQANDLAKELQEFAYSVGLSVSDDAAKTAATIARANPEKAPDDFELTCARVAHELQHPYFNNGHFLHALQVLSEGCRIASDNRKSLNVVKKNNDNWLNNNIALVLCDAARKYLGGPRYDVVAKTMNAIMDLVEDGEAMTSDSVKKLCQRHGGTISPKK